MIDEACLRPDHELLRFLRSHLMLLDLAVQTSPEEAVYRAFGPG